MFAVSSELSGIDPAGICASLPSVLAAKVCAMGMQFFPRSEEAFCLEDDIHVYVLSYMGRSCCITLLTRIS